MTDEATQRWVRNASDELAVKKGCRFDEARAQLAVTWIEQFCKLYEGDWAGQPLKLMPWAKDVVMRLFGWVRWSEKWKRMIRRFRQASIWVPKKNGKSPLLAALGLYLLCGDGEQGQKVFLAAKDGKQAREIAGAHALEMVRQSPELDAAQGGDCTINLNLHRITHRPTRSLMQPLSSSNSRTQESKEGLNGSVLIDEVHVVDREFVNRVSRAGISRSEPMQIEVSTAGNNPDGYGRERFDHARRVEKGEVEDQELFVAIYAAPQDLTDQDLDADPLKYGRLANPAMGITVDEEEYLADYQRSKVEMRKLADFKMYRLNIWQRASNPWLRESHWTSCAREYTEADLEGMECAAALDLSKTHDLSSLVLVFPWQDESGEWCYRLLPYFWLSEQEASEKNHLVPFLAWAQQGFLTLTPGNIIDYTFIRSHVRELAKRFRIAKIYYDPRYAEETTQAIEQGMVDRDGRQIEDGTGVEREIFPQTLMAFTGPCKEFEALIAAGRLHHNNHPIMNWQAGHVEVRTDANQNIRPVKPPRNEVKKIDGIVSAIMGTAGAMLLLGGSVYDREGSLAL